MPFGTRAPSASNFCGSRRKSTISDSSAFASSSPATSSHVTDDDEPGVISIGLTRGIIFHRLPEQPEDCHGDEEEENRQPREHEVLHGITEAADDHISLIGSGPGGLKPSVTQPG